jgi:hypothetical protein
MKAKKKQIKKKAANERKTTSANELAETKEIENWLRIVDKPLGTKEGD